MKSSTASLSLTLLRPPQLPFAYPHLRLLLPRTLLLQSRNGQRILTATCRMAARSRTLRAQRSSTDPRMVTSPHAGGRACACRSHRRSRRLRRQSRTRTRTTQARASTRRGRPRAEGVSRRAAGARGPMRTERGTCGRTRATTMRMWNIAKRNGCLRSFRGNMNTSEDAIRDASFVWRCIMLMLVFSGMATQSVSSFAIPLSPPSPFSLFSLFLRMHPIPIVL